MYEIGGEKTKKKSIALHLQFIIYLLENFPSCVFA